MWKGLDLWQLGWPVLRSSSPTGLGLELATLQLHHCGVAWPPMWQALGPTTLQGSLTSRYRNVNSETKHEFVLWIWDMKLTAARFAQDGAY
jgi:hypothetical protein